MVFYDQYSPNFSAVLPDFQKRRFYQFRPFDDSLSCFRKNTVQFALTPLPREADFGSEQGGWGYLRRQTTFAL